MSTNAAWLRRTQSEKVMTPDGATSGYVRSGTIGGPGGRGGHGGRGGRGRGGVPGSKMRLPPLRKLGAPVIPEPKKPGAFSNIQLRSKLPPPPAKPPAAAFKPTVPVKNITPISSTNTPVASTPPVTTTTTTPTALPTNNTTPSPSTTLPPPSTTLPPPATVKTGLPPSTTAPKTSNNAPPVVPFSTSSPPQHPAFFAPPPEAISFDEDDDDYYLFDEEDGPINILFTTGAGFDRPQIKGGTLEKLVERLTFEKYPDPEYLAAFLLTYRSFTSPTELIDLLITRYNIPTPKNLEPTALATWEQNKRKAIRLRVINVLKNWMQQYWHDFQEDGSLKETLLEFITNRMMSTMESAGKQLKNILHRKTEGTEAHRELHFGDRGPPKPIIPSNLGGALSVLDLDPLELARQLTLIEHNLYTSIKPWELLGQAWTKANKTEMAPGIIAMIHRFNAVSRWCATEICKVSNLADRTKVLTHFIDVAQACNKLNNYNAIMEIVSGLNSSSIYRLKQTWAGIKRDKIKAYTELRELMSRDRNFQAFREHLHNVDPPCIPYLGVYLTDLTFLEDGNKNYIQPTVEGGDPLINFGKRRKVANVISEVRQYQQTPYNLEEVHPIKVYLTKEDFWSEDECYKRSQILEPKTAPGTPVTSSSKSSSRKSKLWGKKNKAKTITPITSSTSSTGMGIKPPEQEEEIDWELETKPDYPFAVEDSKANLIFDIDAYDGVAHPQICAASLPKLIERLTHPSYLDPSLVSTFLFTYTRYTEPHALLDLLIHRFRVPMTTNEALKPRYMREKVMPIRLRVFNLAKQWLDRFFWGMENNESLLMKFTELADIIKNEGMPKAGEGLRKSLERAKMGGEAIERRVVKQPPRPIMPKVAKANYDLYDFDPEEVARQMCIWEHSLLHTLLPPEVLAWSTCGPEERAGSCANILSIQRKNDQITNWIAFTIVEPQDTVESGRMIGFWVKVAQKTLAMNNFNSFVQISRALQHPDIAKLKVVWHAAGSKNRSAAGRFANFLKENQRKLIEKLHTVQPPCVPSLSAYLSQLVKIEEAYADEVKGLINFEKFSQIGSIISDIQHYQQTPFALEEVPLCQEILKKLPDISVDRISELSAPLLVKVKRDIASGSGGTHKTGGSGGTTGSQRGASFNKLAKMLGLEEDMSGDSSILGGHSPSPPKSSALPGSGSQPRLASLDSSPKSSRASSASMDMDSLKASILCWVREDPEFRANLQSALFADFEQQQKTVLADLTAKVAEVTQLAEELKALKPS